MTMGEFNESYPEVVSRFKKYFQSTNEQLIEEQLQKEELKVVEEEENKEDILSTPEKSQSNKLLKDGQFFNPNYTIVQTILDERLHKRGKQYLVKWVALPYEDSTWEFESDLGNDKDKVLTYAKLTYLALCSSFLNFI
jgi:hypothetical protein